MFADEISIDTLEYKQPANNRSGGKVVHVTTVPGSLDWKDRMRFQLSESESENLQTTVWPLSSPMPGQDTGRRTLELTIESDRLLDWLSKLDARNTEEAVKRSPEWFKKSLDPAAVQGMYNNLVKVPSKPELRPSVRVKVKCGQDYPTNIFRVQSEEGRELKYTKGSVEDLQKGVKCMVVVETSGLWFMSRQFGMSLTASDILVWPSKRMTGINAFRMSKDLSVKEVPGDASQPMDMDE